MPNIYLSPSTQEANPYVTQGTEEEWMNRIADAMEPYLRSSGIRFTRNTPQMTAASSIAQSNLGNYDLHLPIHSNAAGDENAGEVRGPNIFYYPGSTQGQRAAEIIGKNVEMIYPDPTLVRVEPNTYLGELRLTKAPAAFIEIAYHDNVEDANWITENIERIARNIVLSLTEYFAIPFVNATPARQGVVRTTSGNLNIRSKPSTNASVIGVAQRNTPITVLGQWRDWYVVDYNGVVGYVMSQFVSL